MDDYVSLAVRAYTEEVAEPRPPPKAKAGGRPRSWRMPRMMLVFDTETATDVGQGLLFGWARLYRIDNRGPYLVEESLFYADDLEQVDPAGYRRLLAYAERQGVEEVRSRREFVSELLWHFGYEARAWIVGFNLPFDLSRLAVSSTGRARAGSRGFSLALWDYLDEETGEWLPSRFRPLISVETIDSKRALIRFGRVIKPMDDYLIPDDDPYAEPDPKYTFPGNFLDLRTLAFVLTGESHSLKSACKALRVRHGKRKAERHGVITARYIDYARHDVQATAELAFALLEEYRRHPITLRPTQARSPASLSKGYLEAMGITPFLEQHPQFPRRLLGRSMVAYIGGRVETRLRRLLVPVVYVDFLSMYPTVNANMGLWRFFTCERIDTSDATNQVHAFVESVTAEQLFQRQTWCELTVLCLVEPAGEVLPARAEYQCGGAWQIGINPLRSRKPLWMTLPDVIAAKLLGGTAPKILEAVRLTPAGLQPGLRPVKLIGEIEVDPARDDFFQLIVEARERLKQGHDLPDYERDWRRLLLKVIVNSASYGITAEINPTNLGSATAPVNVYALDEPFTQHRHDIEKPGRYCFPPLAALITGAARLMLALLEHTVAERGGSHVMCDTDSMAIIANRTGGLIACNGGPHQLPDGTPAVLALGHGEVEAIAARFAPLSPYDPALIDSILKIEDDNYDEHGNWLPLRGFSISAKRYALDTPD